MNQSIRSHFSASDTKMAQLTKANACVEERSSVLEQKVEAMEKTMSELAKQLNPKVTESVAVAAVKKELMALEQKYKKLESEKVGLTADPGCG